MTDSPSTKRVYGAGSLAGVAGRAVEMGSGFAQLWLLTRMLGLEGFGRFAFALTVVQLMAMVVGAGLESLVVFRLSRVDAPAGEMTGRPFVGAVLGWSVVVTLPLAGLVMLIAAPLARALGDPGFGEWLAGLAWMIPVSTALMVFAAWFQSRQRVAAAVTLGQTLPIFVTTVGLAAVYLFGGSARAVVSVTVAAPLLVLLGAWLRAPVNPLRLFGPLTTADAVFAAKATGNGLVGKCLRHADVLMLAPLAGAAAVATYTVALRFARLVRLIHDLLGPVFRPRIGLHLRADDTPSLEREYDGVRVVSTLFALLTALFLVSTGPYLLTWFGTGPEAWPVLLLLVAANLAQIAFGKSGILLVMAGYAGWSLIAGALLVFGNVALNAALIPAWGAAGAAAASLIAVVITQILKAAMIKRLIDVNTIPAATAIALLLALAGLLAGTTTNVAPAVIAVSIGVAAIMVTLRSREQLERMTAAAARR